MYAYRDYDDDKGFDVGKIDLHLALAKYDLMNQVKEYLNHL